MQLQCLPVKIKMINLDLIELADLVRPKDIADEIINQNPDITIPIPLESISYAVGIRDIQYKPLEGLEGALVANREKSDGIILINENAIHQRKRFTLGHELGHFLIPRHGHNMECGINEMRTSHQSNLSKAQRIEQEANQFSAEILMPQSLFQKFHGFRDAPSIDCLISMATHFDVSFEACVHRYVSLHDEPLVIVFSHEGKVRYHCKNSSFPFWVNPIKGEAIPYDSFTKATLPGKSNSIYNGSSSSDTWLNENRDYNLPEEIFEDVYVMENGYAATMLYFEEVIEEK